MLSEIGSSFWIDPKKEFSLNNGLCPEIFGIYGSDFSWLSTGRSAISLVLESEQLRGTQTNYKALLPAYTCESVIEPFTKKGYDVDFFSLNENLEMDYDEIKNMLDVNRYDVFLFHRYFGFDTAKEVYRLVEHCKKKDIVVIEDRTQCLYSDIPLSGADYYVGSIRKWCEAPDGGFIVSKQKLIEVKPTEKDYELVQSKLIASYGKYNYLFNGKGEKATYLNQFAQAEELLDKRDAIYDISEFSLSVQSTLDIKDLKEKRRINYDVIVNGLETVSGIKVVFNSLPDDITPLYLPLIVQNRQEVQLKLREKEIYAPIIWPKAENVVCDSKTQFLYEHLLCIPIDQRYRIDDMKRIVECLIEEKK